MTIALIDADVLCYTAAAAGVHEIDWDGDGNVDVYENEVRAREAAENVLSDWLKASECQSYRLVFSDRTHPQATFRYGIHPHYKAKRPADKPPLHDYVYTYLRDRDALYLPGLEGDDVLGIMATGDNPEGYVAVSIDKDLMTIPGQICNPTRGGGVTRVSQFQADYNWMMQTLMGDKVDNYKGAPGIGQVKATKLLAGCKNITDMWAAVLEGYVAQFTNERWSGDFVTTTAWDEALMNARCARILRAGDYNTATGEVRLWHPEGDVEWRKVA